MDFKELKYEDVVNYKLKELQTLAKELGIEKAYKLNKEDAMLKVIEMLGEKRGELIGHGILDILPDGYGFLRNSSLGNDIYVSASQIKKFSLRIGDLVAGECRKPVSDESNFAILKIFTVDGIDLEKAKNRPKFEDLIPSYPDKPLKLISSNDKKNISGRIIELVSPIGLGQRGIIVSPPKAGKTILIINLANAIIENNPNVNVWILLIDERPEEVTDIKENVKGAEVFASTFDEEPKNHVKVTEVVLEKAKRLVEEGKDVVILMDSLTRLARAYNIVIPSSGKLITGGIDPGALYFPKNFFGAARNIKNGGSLTILATALIDTGSKMDDVIYEEFKGTGNMEVHLDRNLSELRIFPAIDIKRSGTRKEELLLGEAELMVIWKMRRFLSKYSSAEATKRLIDLLRKTDNNDAVINHFLKGGDFSAD